MWTQISSNRWDRNDGAVVEWNQKTPYSNPANPNARMWIAFGPPPSELYLLQRSKRGFGFPRRWKTAKAAMIAVDTEYPISKNAAKVKE